MRSPRLWHGHPERPRGSRASHWAVIAAGALIACGGGGADEVARPGTEPTGTAGITLSTTLPRLDPGREGRYEAWVVDGLGQRHSLGSFPAGGTLRLVSPVADPRAVEITLEPPVDAGAGPSEQMLLRGTLGRGHAELSYAGAVTQNELALREAPGQFTMFTPSDNGIFGYPSHEEAGVWLFNMSRGETTQKDYYVRLTQLGPGWSYEGWMVRDIGQPSAIWLSYGKFVPDWTGAANQPDDTGWGPFSGVTDFRTAQLEDFPGDDWISNPLGLPWPYPVPLPLNLREKDAQGRMRWTHVISIEPATDRGESMTTERPFFFQPYVDSLAARRFDRRPRRRRDRPKHYARSTRSSECRPRARRRWTARCAAGVRAPPRPGTRPRSRCSTSTSRSFPTCELPTRCDRRERWRS